MKANIIIATLIAAATLSASAVYAQSELHYRLPRRPVRSPHWAMHHASTYEEGVLRGWADVRRAFGESNYNHSLAAINRQEAARLGLQNHMQFVQDYFQKKAINRSARYGDQSSRPTQEELARRAKNDLPERLASYEYHKALGELTWPAVFQGALFADERAAVDRAIAERTVENSGIGSASYIEIKDQTARLEAKLRGIVDEMTTAESIAARKFIKSLAYEARLPLSLDIAGLAAK